MAEPLLSALQADCVRRILRKHLPRSTPVRVFGSRATGRGIKPHSDLDLLIDSPSALPLTTIADLQEAFAESDLPFSVDLLERASTSAVFLRRIEREGMVEFEPLPAEQA